MRRVEQHVMEKTHPLGPAIDEMAFASKNLWNLANYHVRQSFIFHHTYLNNTATFHLLKHTDAYQALPAKVANQVLIQLHDAWKAFFEAMEVYREHPELFGGRPNLPKYLHKTEGRNLLVFELGCIWKADLLHREIVVSQLGRLVETKQQPKGVQQVRIVKKADHYVVEVGIRVIVTEESYTSKASFLDLDVLPVYDPKQAMEQEDKPRFSGRRDGRWYRVKGRAPIHSDVNGSYNIARKVFPTAFGLGIEATAVRPRRLAV